MELRYNIFRKLIVLVMVLAIAIPFISPEIFAAAKITAEGGDKVAAGDTFTVRVTYGGEDIGRVDGQLTYDTSKLEYIKGGSSEGDTGYVQLKLAGTDGTITFTLQFKALEAGETNLEITTNEIYDFAEIPLDTPSLTKTITINDGGGNKVEESEKETTDVSQDVTVENEYIDEAEEDEGIDTTFILIISAAVILIIVIIISIVLRRRK